MKKIFFGLIALGTLAACSDDYKDYAAPQANEKETAVNIQVDFTPTNYAIDMSNDADKDVALFSYTTSNKEVETISAEVILVDDYDKIYNDTVVGYGKDGKLYVSANDIEKAVGLKFGSHNSNITYNFNVKADIVAHTASGDGVFIEKTTALPFKMAPIPEYNDGYVLTVNGGKEIAFTKKSDGIYVATFDTEEPNSSILMYAVNGDNKTLMGSYTEDDNAMSHGIAVGTLAKAINVQVSGNWELTIDLNSGMYSYEEGKVEVYMTGSELGWGNPWLKLNVVNSNWDDTGASKGYFWIVRYFKAWEKFKFSPVDKWAGDYGGNQMTVTDNAGAGYSNDGNNCMVENAGWYLLVVRPKQKELWIEKPNIYLIGDAIGGWDADVKSNKFTVPTDADGEFVSPAFTADNNMRMYVRIPQLPIDWWWRSEFNIIDGKIVIRTEGDLPGQWATAGKKAYLNFTNMTGHVE